MQDMESAPHFGTSSSELGTKLAKKIDVNRIMAKYIKISFNSAWT